MTDLVAIGQAARLLGVSTKTIRRWDAAGQIQCRRTIGGHRRITLVEIARVREGRKLTTASASVAVYARVSSYEQKKKGDLTRQLVTATTYCQAKYKCQPVVFQDIGRGLNTKRRGLRALCTAIECGTISRVLITFPDRLTRFAPAQARHMCRRGGLVTVLAALHTYVTLDLAIAQASPAI